MRYASAMDMTVSTAPLRMPSEPGLFFSVWGKGEIGASFALNTHKSLDVRREFGGRFGCEYFLFFLQWRNVIA